MDSIQFLSKIFIILIIICECIPKTVAQQKDECEIALSIYNILKSDGYKVNKNNGKEDSNDDEKEKPKTICCNDNNIDSFTNCDNNHITKFYIRNQNLNMLTEKDLSEVFNLLTKLPYINYISFADNNINSRIPNNINQLTNLEKLSFRNNNLIGIIPENIGDLKQLTYLDLSENKLRGNIPSTFGQLILLKTLNLNDNLIDGVIPYSLKDIQLLEHIQLNNTNIEGYIPDFPKIQDCHLYNSNVCFLEDTNEGCKNLANAEIKNCTEKQIRETDERNGRIEKGKSHIGVISIIGSIVLILVIAVIGGFMYIRKKRIEKERKKIQLNRYNSQYYLNTLQNENSLIMDGSQVSSISPMLTPVNRSLTRISIKNNDMDGNILVRNSIIPPVSPVSPFLQGATIINHNRNPSLNSINMNRSFSVNRMNSINSINRMNSYNSLGRMNSMNMNILANSSFTAGMNNDLYYMPNHTNPDHINTTQGTLPFAISHVNSINGHNIISVKNATEPVIPTRQMTLPRQRDQAAKLTKEEEARIDKENKKNNEEGDDDELPSYDSLQ